MDKIRTVSETKRKFYQYHNRPINSIYRRVVEELMVEMHLLLVNVAFKPDSFYYLGVLTTFDRFMTGYTPDQDKDSIFNALCQSVDGNTEEYKKRSEELLDISKRKSPEDLLNWLSSITPEEGMENVFNSLKEITENPNFKYSRLFAIGLYTLITESDLELVKDDKKLKEILENIAKTFNLPWEKMQKDLDLYQSNLEKMTQMLIVLEDTLEASRKKKKELINN